MSLKVNYIELGAHNGDTIAQVLGMFAEADLRILGVEAHPFWYKTCLGRFGMDARVRMVECAISLCSGSKRLFLTDEANDSTGVGHSIYEGKRNVNRDRWIIVPSMPLSSVMECAADFLLPDAVTVLYANIEGAECDMVIDLDRNDMFKAFDVFCGSRGDFCTDMAKCRELKPNIPHIRAILKKRGVKVIRREALFDTVLHFRKQAIPKGRE